MQVNKALLLAHEARRWLRFAETGKNSGQVVEMFQKIVDGKAQGEPWCMAFVQYCLFHVDLLCESIYVDGRPVTNQEQSLLPHTEHCYTAWLNAPMMARHKEPQVGFIAIWKSKASVSGHAGIVVGIKDEIEFFSVEGNTSDPDDKDQREGDGVYMKRRNVFGMGGMELLGFIDPWPYHQAIELP